MGDFGTSWQRSNEKVCVAVADMVGGQCLTNCSLVEEPVTLTVGGETRLQLEAWRDQHDTGHTIDARLLDAGGNALVGETVTLNVNGTAYTRQTNDTGYVSLHLALLPGETSANMYQVSSVFNGTNPRSVSFNDSDPYGNPYAAFTTNQYDLEPSTNSSTLAVLLQTTDAITAAKTMGKIQQEANNKGWLGTGGEWSWFYPWFRMHVKITLGSMVIDVGFSPIFPGAGTIHAVGLEIFKDVEDDLLTELGTDCLALFSAYVVAKVLSFVPFAWAPAITAMFIKGTVQLALLWRDWSSPSKMLAAALVGVLMALIATEASLATAFLGLLVSTIYGGTWNEISIIEGGLIAAAGVLQSMRTWTDALEIGMDLMFAVTAMAHYQGMI